MRWDIFIARVHCLSAILISDALYVPFDPVRLVLVHTISRHSSRNLQSRSLALVIESIDRCGGVHRVRLPVRHTLFAGCIPRKSIRRPRKPRSQSSLTGSVFAQHCAARVKTQRFCSKTSHELLMRLQHRVLFIIDSMTGASLIPLAVCSREGTAIS
jgi:hypothetical protein